jgi:hypothetical protein
MSRPLALCLEDLASQTGDRFLQCVAVPGLGRGLRLDAQGAVRWDDDDPPGCALVVSVDEKLVLLRAEGGADASVHRAGRSLRVPAGKPVVLIDQDEVEVAGVRWRVHVHGVAGAVKAPTPFVPSSRAAGLVGAMATVAALSACEPGCQPTPPIEVRAQVPAVSPEPTPPPLLQDAAPVATPDAVPAPSAPGHARSDAGAAPSRAAR